MASLLCLGCRPTFFSIFYVAYLWKYARSYLPIQSSQRRAQQQQKRPMELRANTSHSISLQCISIEQTPVQSTPSLASLDISGSVPYSTVCLRFERTFVIKCIARASWRSASTRLPPSNESIIFNFDFLFSFLYFLSLSLTLSIHSLVFTCIFQWFRC